MEKRIIPSTEDPNATKPPLRPLSPSQHMEVLEKAGQEMGETLEYARVRQDQEQAVADIKDTGIPKIPLFEAGLVESLAQDVPPVESLEHLSGRRGPAVARIPQIPYPKPLKK